MSITSGQLLSEAAPNFKSLSRRYLHGAPPQPWPEAPFPLIHETGAKKRTDIPEGHFCVQNAQIMAQTHNTIFRGLNAIYHQAQQVVPGTKDAADLLLFCAIACDFIECHHHAEEMAFFPLIEEAADMPGLMDGNIEQHHALEEGLERLRRYANDTNKWEFDAEELRRAIEVLAGPLRTHMHEEIPTILDLHEKVPSSILQRVYGKMHEVAADTMDKWKSGPFVFGCQDSDFLLDGEKISFPEVPVPVIVPYIIDQVIARRYSGAWRFSPSSAYGRPRLCTGRPTLSRWGPQGLLVLFLIGWAVSFILAHSFGAYVRTIS